ncbi:MAG: flavin reductase family protein [Corynebacterium sp.]|uniref:flavin reductase family protein n=1 Tax=Corynebacterium sp. TaxID=1720 RepID=UPI0026DF7A69|nr:flavin reductase family protein [Corynebacterium sp.]MDO5670770.1 flavin reductase family protein [Corynebacterium sp.]
MTVADRTVTGEQLRAVVGTFPSGVTVVTTLREDGTDVGLTVSAFSSLSLEPAMVLLAVDNNSTSLPYLTVGAPVGISVLADGQGPIAYQFSRRGVDRFAGVDTHRGARGVALIDAAAAYFAGDITAAYPGGDHTILTVAVHDCGTHASARPLLYQRGQVHDWPEYQI